MGHLTSGHLLTGETLEMGLPAQELTLQYLITVRHLLNVHNGQLACKEGQFDVVELMVNDQFKTFSINLNAQHVNGMTPFDLAVHMYGY